MSIDAVDVHFLEGTSSFFLVNCETDKRVDDLTISILGTDHSVTFITFFFVRFSLRPVIRLVNLLLRQKGTMTSATPCARTSDFSGGQRDRKSNRKYHAVYITDKGLTRRRDRFKTDRMTTAFWLFNSPFFGARYPTLVSITSAAFILARCLHWSIPFD